jgi:hypothetical protein
LFSQAGWWLSHPKVREATMATHLSYLRAGSDIIAANSYNVSVEALKNGKRWVDPSKAEAVHASVDPEGYTAGLLHECVDVAKAAIAQFLAEGDLRHPEGAEDGEGRGEAVAATATSCKSSNGNVSAPILAAALGPYGTCLLGRSETANRVADDKDLKAQRRPGYGLDEKYVYCC